VIFVYSEALATAAEEVCVRRCDDWDDDGDRANAVADAAAVLDAIGFIDIVASRERAINLAVALEWGWNGLVG
jgi:hypothetical protein